MGGDRKGWEGESTKALEAMMGLFIILTVMMVSWMCTHFKMYQSAHIDMCCVLHVYKAVLKNSFYYLSNNYSK